MAKASYDKAAGYKADRNDDRIPRCLRMVAELSPPRLLDVGCGDGFFMALAASKGAGQDRMAGLELNAQAAEAARARGFECERWNAEEPFPFADASFDMVFAGEIIEHLVDPETMLAEARRVLAPGGYLLLTTPNLVAWFNRVLVLIGVTPMFVEHTYRVTYGPAYSLLKRTGHPVGHLRIFTWTPLRQVLKDNGFAIVSCVGSAGLPAPLVHQVDRLISHLRPRLAANFIVLARRH